MPGYDGVLCLPGTHSKWVRLKGGKVKGFIFRADTIKITLGSVLTLNATDVAINTSAAA